MNILFKNYYKRKAFRSRIITNDTIKCSCERVVDLDDIIHINFLDMNYFNWWYYELLDDLQTKVVKGTSKLWWIGKIPILNEIVYYTHLVFHKPDYVLITECVHCEEKNEKV